MAKCPYLVPEWDNGTGHQWCLSDKHPQFGPNSHRRLGNVGGKAAYFGNRQSDRPEQCMQDGKGCRFFK